MARELSRQQRLLLICGRYEGVDARVQDYLATDEISISDYVLSGGEIAAMVLVESVTRLLPGALGDPAASFEDSHAEGLLEYPHYTRPLSFGTMRCPRFCSQGTMRKSCAGGGGKPCGALANGARSSYGVPI